MAENKDGQERTEQPTPKRLQEAKQKGQVARSRELGIVMGLLAAAAAFLMIGGQMLSDLMNLLREGLTIEREAIFEGTHITRVFLDMVLEAILIIAPFGFLMMVVGVVSAVVLGGWSVSAVSIKLEKLDPVKGLKRMFSMKALMELLKSLAKFFLVVTAAILVLRLQADSLLGLGGEELMQALAHGGDLVRWAFLAFAAVLLVVAVVDVPFQMWDHRRQLMMTKQEVKEEMKQTEGSPEVKGRQRRLQMEMAQRRMMEAVPAADVVITNPTHYAVALKYDQSGPGAPELVAKGADLIAAQIRSIAEANDVPVLSAPPLARAVYHSTEVGEMIPAGLYRAVAQVLAYVYHLRQGPIYNRQGVDPLDDLPIPDELRRDD